MNRKLTLISAPAGFGKTTLLSEWPMIHLGSEYPLAWVSLEEAENDPSRVAREGHTDKGIAQVCRSHGDQERQRVGLKDF